MFHHAVQHTKCSYELWLLFINNRLQMDQILQSYKSTIITLCQNACVDKIVPFVLDIVLQMLNFISMSDCKHKAMTWIDELLYCSSENYGKGQSEFSSIFTVLPYLRNTDACVLMVYCTYFRVYGKLPKAIMGQIELAGITFCRKNKYIITIEPQKRRLGIIQEKQVQFLPMQLDLQMNLPENSQI